MEEKDRYIQYLLDRQERYNIMVAESSALRKDNEHLSRAFERQLYANRRALQAKEKLRLRTRIKNTEIYKLRRCINDKKNLLTQTMKNMSAAQVKTTKRLSSSESEIVRLESVKGKLFRVAQSKDAEIARLKCRLNDKDAKLQRLLKKSAETSRNSTEYENFANIISETKAKLSAAEAYNKYLQSSQSSNDKLADDVFKLTKRIQLQCHELSEMRQKLQSSQKENYRLKDVIDKCQTDIESGQTLLNSKSEELKLLRNQFEKDGVRSQCENAQQKSLQNLNSKAQKLIETLQNDLNVKTFECNRFASELNSVKFHCDEMKELIETLQTEIKQKDDKHAATVSNLSNEMNRINEEKFAKIGKLKTLLLEKTSKIFTVQQNLEEQSKSLMTAETRAKDFEDLYQQEMNKNIECELRISEKSTALLAVQEMLKKKCDEIANMKADADLVKLQIEGDKNKISALQVENSAAHATIKLQNNSIEDLQKRVEAFQISVKDTQISLNNVHQMLKKKSDELASKRAEADQFKAQLDSASQKISALQEENATVNTNLQQQNDATEDLMKRMETLQTSVTTTKNLLSNCAKLKDHIKYLGTQMKEKDEQIVKEQGANQAKDNGIAQMQQRITAMTAQLNTLMERCRMQENHVAPREIAFAEKIKKAQCEQIRLRAEIDTKNQYAWQLRCVVAEKQRAIDLLTEERRQALEQAAHFKTTLENMSKTLKAKDDELQRQKDEISFHVNATEQSKRIIVMLEKEKGFCEGKIIQLEKSIFSLAGEATLKDKNFTELMGKISSFERKIQELQKKIPEDVIYKERKISELEERISALKMETSCRDQRIYEFQIKIESQEALLRQAETNKDANMIELEANLNCERGQRETLNNQVMLLQQEKQTLIQQKIALQNSMGMRLIELEERNQEITGLKNEVESLQNAIFNLKKVFDSFKK